MNGMISAHLPLSKLMYMRVKALRLQCKFQLDVLKVWMLHG